MGAASPRLVPFTALQRTHSCQPITQAIDEDGEQDQSQCQPSRHIRLLPIRLPVIDHHYQSLPPQWSYVGNLQEYVKSFAKFEANIHCSPLSTEPSISPQKTFGLLKCSLPLVNPFWLFSVFSALSEFPCCFSMVSLTQPHFDKDSWDSSFSIVNFLPWAILMILWKHIKILKINNLRFLKFSTKTFPEDV